MLASILGAIRSQQRELERQRAVVEELTAQVAERDRLLSERDRLIGELESRNAELARFNHIVAHDLKNPLTTIRTFIGVLERDVAAGNHERLHTDLEHIDGAVAKLNRLLDGLYEFSRAGETPLRRDEVDLGGLVRRTLTEIASTVAAGGIEVEVAPDLPLVRGDGAQLLEVVRHLLGNAVQYRGDQPSPRVEVGVREAAAEREPRVFYVRDNGLGIDPLYHRKIFGLFERLEPQDSEGNGVGLTLVKRIVEVHGGRIWVESEGVGRGSTFCFTLELAGERKPVTP